MDNIKNKKVSDKARRIVQALSKSGQPMTRYELAKGIGQARLYDHDLKLLKQLIRAGLIFEYRRRRMHVLHDRNPLAEFEYERAFADRTTRQAYRWGKMGYVYEYTCAVYIK